MRRLLIRPISAGIEIATPIRDGIMLDVLNDGAQFAVIDGRCFITLDPRWGRILVCT